MYPSIANRRGQFFVTSNIRNDVTSVTLTVNLKHVHLNIHVNQTCMLNSKLESRMQTLFITNYRGQEETRTRTKLYIVYVLALTVSVRVQTDEKIKMTREI